MSQKRAHYTAGDPPTSPIPGLAVGRIVHYVMPDGRHVAAIITDVRQPHHGYCALTLFLPPDGQNSLGGVAGVTDCPMDDSHTPHTWHWPERSE